MTKKCHEVFLYFKAEVLFSLTFFSWSYPACDGSDELFYFPHVARIREVMLFQRDDLQHIGPSQPDSILPRTARFWLPVFWSSVDLPAHTQLWKCMHVSYGLCSTRLVAWRVIILTVQKRSVLHLKTLPVILQQSCSPTSMTCLSPNCQGRERQQAARWVWLVSSACQYHPWIVFHGDVCPCILFTGLLCLVDHVSSWSGPFLPCLCQCALLSKWKTL